MNQVIDPTDNDSLLDPFAGEFVYHFNIPVICHPLDETPGLLDIQKNDFNNRILLEVLNSHSLSIQQLSGNSELSVDTQNCLSTVSAKLDLLLHWTGQLVADKLKLPPSINVDINAHGIKLQLKKDTTLVPFEKQNLIFLYLSAHYPEPLRLYTRLLNTHVDENTVEYSLAIENCADDIKLALDKYIFKVHRQDISNLKKRTTQELGG